MVARVSKAKTVHRCAECGAESPQWVGRCPSCSAWNTLHEERSEPRSTADVVAAASPRPITAVDGSHHVVTPSTIAELDRVLGGGFVPGSVTLLGGEPGIGKSTLLLETAARTAARGGRALYVSAEEGEQQVRARAERLGALHPDVWLLSETVLPHVVRALDDVAPAFVVVDSIQTVVDPELSSAPGSVVQVRDCAHRLVQEARRRGVAVVLVGHVTKDGTLAGPRVLEHVVDTVLSFEGDRHHALRLLRAVKHRFGSTSELGVFEMTDGGLVEVADPSGLFLGDRRPGVPGSAVVPALEGHRPLLVEVQALVAPTAYPSPKRSANGIDANRLGLLLAVLQQRAGRTVATLDVYVSAVGGVRLTEPGTDLGVCLALASSLSGQPVDSNLVACGEVGLGGELRQVANMARRLGEAARLGFDTALVPASAPPDVPGIDLVRVESLAEALTAAGLDAPTAAEPEQARSSWQPAASV
jgi:DNA repair protein RadA/Sms